MVTWDEFLTFHFIVQNDLADIKLVFELTGAKEITEGKNSNPRMSNGQYIHIFQTNGCSGFYSSSSRCEQCGVGILSRAARVPHI